MVVSNNMTVQQCKENSPIRHTFSLLGDVSELLGFALQLLEKDPSAAQSYVLAARTCPQLLGHRR